MKKCQTAVINFINKKSVKFILKLIKKYVITSSQIPFLLYLIFANFSCRFQQPRFMFRSLLKSKKATISHWHSIELCYELIMFEDIYGNYEKVQIFFFLTLILRWNANALAVTLKLSCCIAATMNIVWRCIGMAMIGIEIRCSDMLQQSSLEDILLCYRWSDH